MSTDKIKNILWSVITLLILSALVMLCLRLIKPNSDTIEIRRTEYDSMKNELLTLRQINEKVNHIDISNRRVRDSIIADYERRHIGK